jgi:hypothetical protein
MAKYSGTVVRPSSVAHVASARAQLQVKLAEPGTRSGSLVNDDTIVVDVPSSGAFEVDLIPSPQILSRSGRPAVYSVAESWLDPDGVQIPGGYSEWGTFYLGASGGTLSQYKVAPPGTPVIEWVSTLAEAQALEPTLAKGSIIIVAGSTAWTVYEVS